MDKYIPSNGEWCWFTKIDNVLNNVSNDIVLGQFESLFAGKDYIFRNALREQQKAAKCEKFDGVLPSILT